MPAVTSEGSSSSQRASWLALAFVAVGSLLRWLGCVNDLGLDEIWALQRVAGLRSPLEVLTELRIDNHVLYGLYLQPLGLDAPDWVYRIPAWLFGTSSLALVGLAARLQLPQAAEPERARLALVSLALVASSSLLVQFDSEARGYAPALAFSLAGFVLLLWHARLVWSWWVPAYWSCGALALLAQPIAVHAWLAAACWTALRAWRGEGVSLRTLGGWALWNGPVVLCIGVLYFAHVTQLASGGGPPHGKLSALHAVAVPLLGIPPDFEVIALPTLAALLLGGCALLAWRRDDLWIYFLVGSVASPVLFDALAVPYADVRYHLVGVLLLSLLLARGLAFPFERRWQRALALAIAALIVVGNGLQVVELLRVGRGSYKLALAHAIDGIPSGPVRIGSNQDFRTGMLVAYHAARVAGGERIEFVPRYARAFAEPAWLVHEANPLLPEHPERVWTHGGQSFTLERVFPARGVSGVSWLLYRRDPVP